MFEILSLINSPEIQSYLFWIKIPMIFITIVLIAFLAFLILRTTWFWDSYLEDFFEFFTFRPFGIRRITKSWNNIQVRLETQNEDEYKLAITEADHIIATVIKKMGAKGESVEEQLNSLTGAIITNLEDLKKAHTSRNDIVHNPDYKLSLDEAKKILSVYEKSFRVLDLI